MNPLHYSSKIILKEKYVIELKALLGEGSFAVVHKGYMYGNEKELIAIKTIDKRKIQKQKSKETIIINYINREKNNQQQLSGPNIVKMIDFVENDEGYYFILEFCDEGSLETKLSFGLLPQDEVFKIFKQIVKGYKEINEKKIIHRDLKPQNILFSKGVAKIADFGFSKLLDEINQNQKQTNLGTPEYCAPEVQTGQYSSKADVWSLGVILYKMLYGKTTMKMLIDLQMRNKDIFYVHYPKNIKVPDKYFNLLQRMLTKDSNQRISWDEIFTEISQVLEIQEILSDSNTKVISIFNYFLYIQDILKFIRQIMREVQENNYIIQLSLEQQLSYSVITQKYILNELAYYINVLKGQNLLFIQMLPGDFQLFKQSDKYDQTLDNFEQNYIYLKDSYNQVKIKYEQFQKTSQRMSTENTNQMIKQAQFQLPNVILKLQCNQNDQIFGETFNLIYNNIIEHIKSKLNIMDIQIQQKQSVIKVLIKLLYCLQPLQFSHRILEPLTIELKLLNSSSLEMEFNTLYAKQKQNSQEI